MRRTAFRGGMRLMPRLWAAYSSYAPCGESACYASNNSEYTYRDFLTSICEGMSGIYALPYAKVCHFCVIFIEFRR